MNRQQQCNEKNLWLIILKCISIFNQKEGELFKQITASRSCEKMAIFVKGPTVKINMK